jgi:hypothetical protein
MTDGRMLDLMRVGIRKYRNFWQCDKRRAEQSEEDQFKGAARRCNPCPTFRGMATRTKGSSALSLVDHRVDEIKSFWSGEPAMIGTDSDRQPRSCVVQPRVFDPLQLGHRQALEQ